LPSTNVLAYKGKSFKMTQNKIYQIVLLTFTDFFKVMLFDEILSIPPDNEG
jgi:hypothetical protein